MPGLQHKRAAKGLCPQCGMEAAPFYLCPDCRAKASLRHGLNRMEKYDVIHSEKLGREKLWKANPRKHNQDLADLMPLRPCPLWGEGKGAEDGRMRPRLGRIPVDIMQEIIGIFLRLNQPLTEPEIYGAWGKLRVRRGRASAAGDLAALIKAERRRERRNRKAVDRFIRERPLIKPGQA